MNWIAENYAEHQHTIALVQEQCVQAIRTVGNLMVKAPEQGGTIYVAR